MDIKGRIILVHPVENGVSKNNKAWAKQSFVIETGGNYPKKIALTLWGEDKINQYDLQPGREITAHLELESREYNGRWYTEARAWKIEWTADARQAAAKTPQWQTGTSSYKAPEPKQENAFDNPFDDSSLPFLKRQFIITYRFMKWNLSIRRRSRLIFDRLFSYPIAAKFSGSDQALFFSKV